MATTRSQDNAFGGEFLEQIVGWIADNLEASDVFPASELEEWARSNGFHTDDECPAKEE